MIAANSRFGNINPGSGGLAHKRDYRLDRIVGRRACRQRGELRRSLRIRTDRPSFLAADTGSARRRRFSRGNPGQTIRPRAGISPVSAVLSVAIAIRLRC
jgi:hypothetical protein